MSFFTIELIFAAFVGLGLLVLSRFGLAMPALIVDNYRVAAAMFRSDELTERKWFTLAVLLFKSVVGGYLAGMCPFWLASWTPASISLPSWFPWFLRIASVAGVVVVEPTMFIGFAMLYLRISESSNGNVGRQSSVTELPVPPLSFTT
jgi:hypothetical protein